MLRALVVLTTVVVLAAPVLAEDLPAGAVARLGDRSLRHERPVLAVGFSKDGARVVSVSEGRSDHERSVRTWDRRTRELLREETIGGREDAPRTARAAALSPDLGTFAQVDHDGVLWISSATSGAKPVKLMPPGGCSGARLLFAPDGRSLAVATRDGAARVFALGTWRETATLRHGSDVADLAFSPAGERLATAGADGAVRVWDLATERAVATIEHDGPATHEEYAPHVSVAFVPGTTRLVACSAKAGLALYDERTGERVARNDRSFAAGRVAVALDGSFVVTGDRVAALPSLDMRADRDARPGEVRVRSPFEPIAIAPDGTVALGRYEGAVELLDPRTEALAPRGPGHRGHVLGLDFSSDGARLLSVGEDDRAIVWDVKTRRPVKEVRLGDGCGGERAGALSPDGGTVAVMTRTEEGQQRVTLAPVAGDVAARVLLESEHRASALVFSPDGRTLAVELEDRTVRLLDVASGREKGSVEVARDFHFRPRFSPDGRTLAVSAKGSGGMMSGRKNEVALVDAATGRVRAKLGPLPYVSAVAFAPDGQRLVAGLCDAVAPFTLATSKALPRIPCGEGVTWDLAAARDGRVAVAVSDGSVHVLRDGKPLARLEGHRTGARAVAFTTDGRLLATGGEDGTVVLWETSRK